MKNGPNPSLYTEEKKRSQNTWKRRRLLKRILTLVLSGIFLCVSTLAAVEIWPSLGAQAANTLRDLFGPQVVARLETVVFQAQDALKQWQYQSGIEQAEGPWDSVLPGPSPTQTTTAEPSMTPTPSQNIPKPERTAPPATERLAVQDLQTASPSPTPTRVTWPPANLTPLGTLEGEGIWTPYLFDAQGNMVSARTFLQPDPERPYAIVAVVAFDLTRTRLHFVLGFNDPGLPDGPKGDGLIPDRDRQAGVLLAAFNGGFRTANGQFGAMAGGVVALPPLDGMATVGIYKDGTVRLGSWGTEITDSPELVAWRQNCPLVIQDGEISPRVYNESTVDWGGTISNQIVTRRSGMGLDEEAKTLYYFAGPGLSMPALADAMRTAGVHNGMLLDINHFWVHFTAIRAEGDTLLADPLLPNDMIDHVDRYLNPSPVDFFYVTLRDTGQP